ncbi:MAG: 16S rRNA (uracil(1498)-N(3))-methyltransferase [Epsilonproteobacteria bacterium]|nr:16S rRNA (uracil(1498)-N(3))-methyltransferase [Campylobacterota bacterium]
MQYLYHKESSIPTITLRGDEHRYIFKVRRHKEGETIALRNLEDSTIYYYKIVSMDKKEANLLLQDSKELTIKAKRELHIGWCIIEPKNIEKVLPTLNELGVASISFIYCKRSQKNFKLDFKRLEKILLNSSQQSGRSEMMRLEVVDNLESFLKLYPDSVALNFSDNILKAQDSIDSIVIGCEGGFTDSEIELFGDKIVGLDTTMVLKSESATCAVASLVLL